MAKYYKSAFEQQLEVFKGAPDLEPDMPVAFQIRLDIDLCNQYS